MKRKYELTVSHPEQEITRLKKLISDQAARVERAGKMAKENEDSLFTITGTLENKAKEFSEEKKILIAYADKAEIELSNLEAKFNNVKSVLSQLTRNVFGPTNSNNLKHPKEKLGALSAFIKQLFVGSGECLKKVRNWKNASRRLIELITELFNVPQWIEEHKISACRQGAIRAFALAKAYHPELNPELLAGGFPQFKADSTLFSKEDYEVVKEEIQHNACIITEKLKLKELHPRFRSQW